MCLFDGGKNMRLRRVVRISILLIGLIVFPPSLGHSSEAYYRWAGIFPGDGVILRPVSTEFIEKHIAGEPFTWKSLRKAFASICPEDQIKVKIGFKYHVIKPTWEAKGSSSMFSYSSREGIDLYLKEYLYPGGVYSIFIKPTASVLLSSGKCGGMIFGGPLAYKIVPLENQRDLLVLGPLGKTWDIPDWEGNEIRFTMTSNGPRLPLCQYK